MTLSLYSKWDGLTGSDALRRHPYLIGAWQGDGRNLPPGSLEV